MIKSEIVGHSLSPQGDELISVLCTFPRIILAEVNTHRMLSKNTSSSRAIPFKKMVESVQNDPFIPIAWQKEHKGMQGSEYLTGATVGKIKYQWLSAREEAVKHATALNKGSDVTKQLCNRLLEPFMWTTMLITGSREGWDNFFHLRCPSYETETGIYKSKKDAGKYAEYGTVPKYFDDIIGWLQLNKGQAEIHIMDLAEKIYDAVNESTPNQLEAGEWHIPFVQNLDLIELAKLYPDANDFQKACVKISTAMAARTSYTVVGEEKGIDYKKMIELHDRLLSQEPPHSSPLEHCARAMSHEEYKAFIRGEGQKRESGHYKSVCGNTLFNVSAHGWCFNLKGFISYRYMIDNNYK